MRLTHRFFWLTCAIIGVSLSLPAQTCQQPVVAGTPDDSFNALFTQNGPGWTGGDSTYSIALPDGRKVFFFSDSYIASTPIPNGATVSPATRTRTSPLFQAHNSLVVLNLDGSLTTIAGGDPQNPTSLFSPANSSDVYWMGDSTVIQNADGSYQLVLYLLEFNGSTFQFMGTSVARLSLPNLTVQSVTPLSTQAVVEWGSAVLRAPDHIYIYGMEDRGIGKYPHVARTTASGLSDTSTWQFWNGSAWVSGESNSVRIIDAPDSISNEYNVNRITVAGGEAYVMTTMDTSVAFGTWKDIVLYFSCSPQGPWSAKQVVYSTPETGTKDHSGAGTLLTYNPHSHFEFAQGDEVLISYNLNTTNSADLIYADDYRPKFIRVRIVGMQ